MRGLLLSLALVATGAGCAPGEAVDPEAAFATWLAALPAPQPGPAFSCDFVVRADIQVMMQATTLTVRGALHAAGDSRLRVEVEVDAEMPELPVPVQMDTSTIGGGGTLVYDGSKAWLVARSDAEWLTRAAQANGFDLDGMVLTLESATVERLSTGLRMALLQALSLDGTGGEGESPLATAGPAYWVHMVGRTTEVRSFRRGAGEVEVGFGLDPALLPELPGTDPALTRQAAQAMLLRMVFDATDGSARAVRLEHEAVSGKDRLALRVELSGIRSDEPDAAGFRFDAGTRQPMPLDALLMPLLANLPEAADADLDF